MSYKDWRDNCNPDLLYRLWKRKGKKEPFVRYKFGQKFITYPTPMGDFTMIERIALTSKEIGKKASKLLNIGNCA